MLFRLILTLIVATGTGVALAQPKGDDLILDMHQAWKKGDRKRLAALLPQVRGHALEPWGAYWELRARLDEAGPQEVRDFLTRWAGTYQEDRLRNDWLQLLGQRRDWGNFAAEYPNWRMRDDREVQCYGLLVQHLSTGEDTSAEVRRHWLAQREADDGCTIAADRLLGERKLTPLDAWRKARLAVEANRPKAARAAVELVAPDVAAQVPELIANPAKFLSSRVVAASKVRKEMVTLALVRMAANDPDAAAGALENKWAPQLTTEERNWAWGAVGRASAGRLGTEALSYFANVTRDADLTDEMLAWKVRAALRAASQPRWPLVLAAIQAMGEETRRDPAWVYWKARALKATAPAARSDATASRPEVHEAHQLLESIAGINGFYEQLAQEELGRQVVLPPVPAPLTTAEMEGARLNPGLNRGLYAILIGLRGEGVREWNYSTNLHTRGGMPERERLAAAQFACEREVWDRCINTSERTRSEVSVAQRFPMPFRESVVRRSGEIGLDPAYVYGLIRQESRFVMDARSHVGASGLMQVMPATARWTARKIGLTGFTIDQLNDRDTNIAIGTGYLKLVLDDFEGSMPLAAAAYNAGPSRPRNWRAPGGTGPVLDAAVWAENVPFTETREYVKRVLANTTVYAAILSGQPQSLRARLGRVGPRDAAATTENKDLP